MLRAGALAAAGLLLSAQDPLLPTPSPSPPPWEVLDAPAPDARFRRLAGGTLALQTLRGKVVVLDFWTTWCEPCLAELPALRAFHDWARARGDVIFLSVNDDAKAADLAGFLRAHRPRYPLVLMDTDNALRVEAYPTKLIVDRAGVLRLRARGGPVPLDELCRRALSVAAR
jgi:thiol-disulfide isomerase/thioredoxin